MADRRRWFQIHLSTAVILMIESGALIGLNVVPSGGGMRGWPETFIWWKPEASLPHSFDVRRFVIDAATVFIILTLSCKISEWRIRRHEARKS